MTFYNKSYEDNEIKFVQLMQLAQNGNNSAYENLLQEISPLLRGFIFKRIGDSSDNEDILQEILFGIHRAGHTYNTARPFTSWMFAIADYKVKDYLRSQYRKKQLKQIDFIEAEELLAKQITEEPKSKELLNELFAVLPKTQRRIVYMMKIDGYTAEQVAKSMDMSVSNVKVTAHRAYKLLIARWRKKGVI